MLKLFFTVVLVSLAFFCTIKENEAALTQNEENPSIFVKEYDPFIVVSSLAGILPKMPKDLPQMLPTSSAYKLPSKFVKFHDEWRLASETTFVFESPSCPELITTDEGVKDMLEFVTQQFPGTDKCLFAKDFKEDERKICTQKPTPVIEKREDNIGLEIVCGVNQHQKLVDVQYYHCGTDKTLEEYGVKLKAKMEETNNERVIVFQPEYLRMYEVCYDFHEKKTVWTKHTPMTPAILAHPESPYKGLSNEIQLQDFSTDTSSLDLYSETFSNLKKSYESTDVGTSTIYTLVPKEHMALLYWKNATTHMINSAPLLPEFIPLMEAINNGILQASNYLFEKWEETLQIYTKAETKVSNKISFYLTKSARLVKSKLFSGPTTPVDLFESNIWYTFVHNEKEESGVLIVLHNVRGELPQQKECSDNKLLTCDFKSWSSFPEFISDDHLNHAYCCKVIEEQVKGLFSINNLRFRRVFDIQATINEANEEKNDQQE